MRHSTLLSWLQNGQLKTVASFSWPLFGGGFAADFRFPIAPHAVPTPTQRHLEPRSSLDSQEERLAHQNNTQQRVATKWEVSESNAAAKRHQWSSIQGLAESAHIYGFRRRRAPALQLRLRLVSGSVPARQVTSCFGITAEPSPSLHDTRARIGPWFGW